MIAESPGLSSAYYRAMRRVRMRNVFAGVGIIVALVFIGAVLGEYSSFVKIVNWAESKLLMLNVGLLFVVWLALQFAPHSLHGYYASSVLPRLPLDPDWAAGHVCKNLVFRSMSGILMFCLVAYGLFFAISGIKGNTAGFLVLAVICQTLVCTGLVVVMAIGVPMDRSNVFSRFGWRTGFVFYGALLFLMFAPDENVPLQTAFGFANRMLPTGWITGDLMHLIREGTPTYGGHLCAAISGAVMICIGVRVLWRGHPLRQRTGNSAVEYQDSVESKDRGVLRSEVGAALRDEDYWRLCPKEGLEGMVYAWLTPGERIALEGTFNGPPRWTFVWLISTVAMAAIVCVACLGDFGFASLSLVTLFGPFSVLANLIPYERNRWKMDLSHGWGMSGEYVGILPVSGIVLYRACLKTMLVRWIAVIPIVVLYWYGMNYPMWRLFNAVNFSLPW